MRLFCIAIVLALVAPANAQQACPECARGDALIAQYGLEALRGLSATLATTPFEEPLSPDQYAHILAIREHDPSLIHLGAIDDTDLGAIAVSLCHATLGECVDRTTTGLRCLADRCKVALPPPPPHTVVDVAVNPPNCHQFTTTRHSSPLGLGMDWSTGYHTSKFPNDGHAWAFGIEGRVRFNKRIGVVARVDRIAGRDEATDADGNGQDDIWTGSITRIVALGGPSIILDNARFENTSRSLRLDLLGGYMSTRSQVGETGPAAGFDLSYQLWSLRMGARVIQGFGDARDATTVLAHIGVLAGGSPDYRNPTDCGAESSSRSSPLAIGFDIPLGGYGLSHELGYLATGIGIESLWHLSPALDAMARADLLVYPGDKRDRVLQQAVLAGMRIDHGKRRGRSSSVGFFSTVMGGYSYGSGLTPSETGSGPVVDLSFAWGGQGSDGAGYFRLHTRFGIGPDNLADRAIFLSGGFELRIDPRRWKNRM